MESDVNSVILKINGTDYKGWTSVSINSSLESFYRSFTVESSRRITKNDKEAFEVEIGNKVEVWIGKDKVVTGFITKVNFSYTANSYSLRVEGKGCSWVMCSSVLPLSASKTYEKISLTKALKQIASYFDVNFESKIPLTENITLSFSPDEQVQGKLESLVKRKSLLLSENENGVLVLARVGSGGTCFDSLMTGENILSCNRTDDATNMYQDYLVYGQGTNPDSIRPVSDNQLVGTRSSNFCLPRVLAKKQTGDANQIDVDARASLLMNYSKATRMKVTYCVQGWRQSNGALWRVNQLVRVVDDLLNINKVFVISNIDYSLGGRGMTVTMALAMKEAFRSTELDSSIKKATAEKPLSFNAINESSSEWTMT